MTNPESQELDRIKSLIRAVPDFPKAGILFQDIFPVFQDASAIKHLVGLITTRIQGMGPVDAIVGLDSRGFLLGPWIASNLGIAFCPVRKSGKLPPPCHTVTYDLEYGSVGHIN